MHLDDLRPGFYKAVEKAAIIPIYFGTLGAEVLTGIPMLGEKSDNRTLETRKPRKDYETYKPQFEDYVIGIVIRILGSTSELLDKIFKQNTELRCERMQRITA